jgi:hypothetical protein
MQQAAFGPQQPVVDGLLDEGMTEPEGGLREPGRLLQEILRAQLVQGRPQRLVCPAHRGQQRAGELGAQHGRETDGFPCGRAQPVHPGPDEALQCLRHLLARRLVHPPCALLVDQGPRLQQRGQPLLQVQGVAFDAGQHGVQDLPAGVLAE